MSWISRDDDALAAAVAATDRYLREHPDVAKVVVSAERLFDHLMELPPMTVENAFSGNLTPIIEASSEIRASVMLARMGLYKQALTTLRSAFELGLLAVYWDSDDTAHSDIQDWLHGHEPTPRSRIVERRLAGIDGVATFVLRDPAFFSRARTLAYTLGGYVHTRGAQHSSRGLHAFSNAPAFSENALTLWSAHLIEVARTVLALHVMKYPVALQITPLSEKFGMNGPAGGFVEPHVREFFRDVLDEGTRDLLQMISDEDEQAQALAGWVNGLPDVTEEDIVRQVEAHDALMRSHRPSQDDQPGLHRSAVDQP